MVYLNLDTPSGVGVTTNNNSLNNKHEALIMQNQNSSFNTLNAVNTYCKPYPKFQGLKDFSLSLRGELDEKLKKIIKYYKAREHLNDIEIIEIVIQHGLVRCYKMSYLFVKYHLFKISEIDRDVDIYDDVIYIVEEKEDLINSDIIKYEKFWIKNEYHNPFHEKRFNVTGTYIKDIVSLSLTICGILLEQVEDCMSVFHQEYNYSPEKSLEHMLQVGINNAFELVGKGCSTAELIENNIFELDYE
jgi:hypothetical protein